MQEQQSADNVLVLSDELLGDGETAGADATPIEPGTLLLDNELPAEPVIKKIEVGPRVTGSATTEDAEEQLSAPDQQASSQQPEPRQPQRKGVWRGGLPAKPAATFLRRNGQESALPAREAAESALLLRSLAEARAYAAVYAEMNARTRQALYGALGRTYDLAVRAEEEPEQFARLVAEAGLTSTDRAPHTPIVKLVFGADYDKTRLAEFAAAIAYARRRNVPMGQFAAYLETVEGGIKAVVGFERLIRKGEPDHTEASPRSQPGPAISRKLRAIRPTRWDEIPAQGEEFALLVARRLPDGSVVMVGEVPNDVGLLEKAARKLLAELDRSDVDDAGPGLIEARQA